MDRYMIKVALDAMGGDNAPVEIVKGAIAAVNAVILNVLESLLNFIFISPFFSVLVLFFY